MKKLHIGFNCPEYPPCRHGGVGSYTKDLAEGLVSNGINVTVFGLYYPHVLELSGVVDEVVNGVRVIRLPMSRLPMSKFWKRFGFLNHLVDRFRIMKLLRKLHNAEPFDLIESPEDSGWFPAGGLPSVPLVTRLHGGQVYFKNIFPGPASRLHKILERRQLLKTDHIVAVSQFVGEKTMEFMGISTDFKVIYNGVDLLELDKLNRRNLESQDEKIVLFYGSIMPKKGVEQLLRASFVFLKGNEYTVCFAGRCNVKTADGTSYLEYLKSIIPDAYRHRIFFLGPLDREGELFPLIAKARICCFPSMVEAFAIAPLEAMALEKSVIYTKFISGPEAIEHGVSGLLCDPNNIEEISQEVIRLIGDDSLRSSIGGNARLRVEKLFDTRNLVLENIEYYRECLEK